jgi:hypothetical protein
MKQPNMLAPSLKDFRWEELVNLHLELSYLRKRFIQAVNQRVASQKLSKIEALEQLAKVDDSLRTAVSHLDAAKSALFNLCYNDPLDG